MSEGAFHAYVGLLALSGLVLSVLAVRGFDQRALSRVLDGLFAAGFLGYAVYLIVVDPGKVYVFYYAFAAPVLLLVHMVRQRRKARARRFATGFPPQAYEVTTAPTPLTPFPPPPPPLRATTAEAPPPGETRAAPPRGGLSGLSNLPPPTLPPSAPDPPGPRPPMPSGLPPAPPAAGPPLTAPGLHGIEHGPPPPPGTGPGRRPDTPGRAGHHFSALGNISESPRPGWQQPGPPPPAAEPEAGGSPVPGWRPRHGRHEEHDTPGPGRHERWPVQNEAPPEPHGPPRHSAPDARYSDYRPGERYAGHDTHDAGEQQGVYETTSRLRRPAWLSSNQPAAEPEEQPEEHGRHSRPGDERPPAEWPPRHG